MLDVGDGHRLYYEVHGPATGRPVVVLHGGPGGGLQKAVLKSFGPKWRVILFDQRGCGRSTPRLSLQHNTTWDLVADIERLRLHLGIESWTVFGGSWGSTLAMAYASKHMDRIDAMVLRGVFLAEPWENRWMSEPGGAARVFPQEWRTYSRGRHGRRLTEYYGRLLRNRRTRRAAAKVWTAWEAALSHLRPTPDLSPQKNKEEMALMENHYFRHNCWIRPGQLLAVARRIPASIPVYIVQGRYDMVCPAASAFALASAIPHARLRMTIAGHSASEPETAAALRVATDAI